MYYTFLFSEFILILSTEWLYDIIGQCHIPGSREVKT